MLDFLSLPKLDSDALDCIKMLLERSTPFQLPLAMRDAQFTMVIDQHGRGVPREDLIHITLETTLGKLELTIELGLLDMLSDGILPDWREAPERNLPLGWRVIAAIDTLLEQAPLAGFEWNVKAVTPLGGASFGPNSALFSISLGDKNWGCALLLKGADPVALASLMGNSGASIAADPTLEFKVDTSLTKTDFYLHEAAAIRRGDLVLLPGANPDAIPATIRIADHCAWLGTITPTGDFIVSESVEKEETMTDMFTAPELSETELIETELQQEQDDEFEQQLNQDFEDELDLDGESEFDDISQFEADAPIAEGGTETHAALEPAAEEVLADLPVQFEVSLKPKFLPLSEFSGLNSGAAVPLDLDLTETVRISANGKTFGFGRLVQIGDRVGVQIDHWRATSDQKNG